MNKKNKLFCNCLKPALILCFAITFSFIAALSMSSCCPVFTAPVQATTEQQETAAQETPETAAAKDNDSLKENASDNDNKIRLDNLIKVSKPVPGQLIESPLIIEGEARGIWFFEGDFPVILISDDGEEIAVHYAVAQDDWMTEDFVPFKSELVFTRPVADSGVLILKKDNPKGDPEYDDEIRIPVLFK